MEFPIGFLIGVASSSYQIEGGWNSEGKGENIWDRFVHSHPELIADRSNGDIAGNSYQLYKEDVALIKEIGFDFYRFSVSWARILPSGEAHNVNNKGLMYYDSLINELLQNGIQPMVTMYHWDLPQKLQDMGGWLNPLIVDYFEDYAEVLFKNFGSKVKVWITINEPNEITAGYGDTIFAPALDLHGVGEYLAGHHLLKAHARAYRLYQNKFKGIQKGKISLGISGLGALPMTESADDVAAANRSYQFSIGWFAHAIFSKEGDYPEIMKEKVLENSLKEGRLKSRLPTFTEEEINLLKGSADFFAYQHYTSVEVTSDAEGKDPSISRDSYVKTSANKNWVRSSVTWLNVVPEGLRHALNWIKEQYGSPEIFITENGYGESLETTLEDYNRINYFAGYLRELLKSIQEDHCRVIGYTAWTLMDNFEWLAGYRDKFGLIQVNFEDPERKRTMKKSALFFQEILKARKTSQQNYSAILG